MSEPQVKTYFHFTPESAWEMVQREGLVPQPIKSFHPEILSMCKDLQVDPRGIYLWPQVTQGLLRDFFLFKQVHDRSVDSGLLLAVQIDPTRLLGTQWLNYINHKTEGIYTLSQKHDLTFTLADGSKRCDHVAAVDLHLDPIPLESINMIASIRQTIEVLDDSFSCLTG
jgi:hypothetical protein